MIKENPLMCRATDMSHKMTDCTRTNNLQNALHIVVTEPVPSSHIP